MSNLSLNELQLAISSEQGFVNIVKQSPPEKTMEMALLLLSGYQWRIVIDGGEAAYGDSALFHFLKQEEKLIDEIELEMEKPVSMQRVDYLSGLKRLLGEVRYYLGEIYLRMGKLDECEAHWEAVPSKYTGWKALHLSDAALRLGERNDARAWCLSVQCAEDSLLFLEKHWQLYHIYRTMNWHRDAVAALQVVLSKEPQYRQVEEEGYQYFRKVHQLAAYELCCSRYAATGNEEWAEKAVEVIGEIKPDVSLLEPSRLLLASLAGRERWEHWDRLAEIMYEREQVVEGSDFIEYWLDTLTDLVPRREVMRQLYRTGGLLLHLLKRCDKNEALRADQGQVAAWILMHFGVVAGHAGYLYEGAVRLLAMDGLNREERLNVIDLLRQTGYYKLEQRTEKAYPWLKLAEAPIKALESAGLGAAEFHEALAGANGGERRILFAGGQTSGRGAILSALLGEEVYSEWGEPDKRVDARIFTSGAAANRHDPCPGVKTDNRWLDNHQLALIELSSLQEWPQLLAEAEDILQYADAYVLVLDAARPLTRLDREFIKGLLSKEIKAGQCAFVLGRTDVLGRRQLEKAERQVVGLLTELLGAAPKLFVPAHRRKPEAGELEAFLLSALTESVAASRFERFDRRYGHAFAHCDRRLEQQAYHMSAEAERYMQLQAHLKPMLEQLNKDLLANAEGIETVYRELKLATSGFMLAHIPGLMHRETSEVYLSFDYKALPDLVDQHMQQVLEQWVKEQLPPFFEKELDGLSWHMERSFDTIVKQLADLTQERERLIAGDEAWAGRMRLANQELWPAFEEKLAAAISEFMADQSCRISVLTESKVLRNVFRGLSSFFGGADKALGMVREELIGQLENNGPLVAERMQEQIFAAFEKTVLRHCRTMLDASRELLAMLEGDIELAKRREEQCGQVGRRSAQVREQLQKQQELQQYPMALWRVQVQQGVLLENGTVFRLN